MKKIVISIISYNQENLISRALDSVLCQKDWGLYKIVVSDDCSFDRTWDILQDYQCRYPDLFILHRNENNLGIYGNVEKVESLLPQGELYGSLSGDDEYCKGYFEAIQKYIRDHRIDTDEPVGFFSDWKSVSPEGNEEIHTQKAVLSEYPLLSLKLRGLVSNRSFMVTKCVRDSYGPMILDRGLALAEGDYDIQPFLFISTAYYIQKVTSIYYTRVGVSSRLSVKESDYLTTQSIIKWKYFLEGNRYILNSTDEHYARYELLRAQFYLRPSIIKICRMMNHFCLGQLPGFKPSIKIVIHLLLSYIKYWISK